MGLRLPQSTTLNNNNNTVQALNTDGMLTDTFTVTTLDGTAQLVTITINGANDAPVGVNDAGSATEAGGVNNSTPGSNATGNVLSNDTDVDNTNASLVVSAIRTGAVEGSGTAGTLGSGLTGAHGTLTLNANGTYTYVINETDAAVQALNVGQTLTDSFNYTVKDPGNLTDTAVLTITINGAYDMPGVPVIVVVPPGQMGTEWHVVGANDFGGDGTSDIMWARNTTGDCALWTMSQGTLAGFGLTQGHMGAEWTAASTSGDFNHDGKADVLWSRNSTGDVAIWEMNGPNGHMGAEWHVRGVGDFNQDSFSDILWVSDTNQVSVWSMNGLALSGFGISNGHMGVEWNVAAVANFDGSGGDDILWVAGTPSQPNGTNAAPGDVFMWMMNGANVTGLTNVGHMGPEWHVAGTGDFNRDGKADIVWVDTSNNVVIWTMNGGQISQFFAPTGHMGTEWKLTSVGDLTGDGRPDLLWVNGSGQTAVWDMRGFANLPSGNSTSNSSSQTPASSTAQLVQAMASFAPNASADSGLSAINQASQDASAQMFGVTNPLQHAA
jgi:VCBS repeat-containing protein